MLQLHALILQIRNEKAKRYLSSMRRKKPTPFTQKFPNADPRALSLLERMLAFEPKDRPSAEEVTLVTCFLVLHYEVLPTYQASNLTRTTTHTQWQALADPYFKNIANVDREPSAQPVTKLGFEYERRRVTKEDIRELIYKEILEYHPKMLREFLEGTESSGFMYPRCIVFFTHILVLLF
jgi:mitogen-activated protein kinase 1/3